MFKLLKFLFTLVILFVIAVIGFLGYLGFVPWISALFNSDQPRDLGVVYDEQNLTSAQEKINAGLQLTALQSGFTSEELTALANNCQAESCSFDDLQVKISDDGVMEVSGIFDPLKSHLTQPPFYIRGVLMVDDDQIDYRLEELALGRIVFPPSWLAVIEGLTKKIVADQLMSL